MSVGTNSAEYVIEVADIHVPPYVLSLEIVTQSIIGDERKLELDFTFNAKGSEKTEFKGVIRWVDKEHTQLHLWYNRPRGRWELTPL